VVGDFKRELLENTGDEEKNKSLLKRMRLKQQKLKQLSKLSLSNLFINCSLTPRNRKSIFASAVAVIMSIF